MTTDDFMRIGGPGAPQNPEQSSGAKPVDSTEFRRLLERLEGLSRDDEPTVVKNAEDLEDAIRKADDDFASAMDMRRRLEDAFRRSTQ